MVAMAGLTGQYAHFEFFQLHYVPTKVLPFFQDEFVFPLNKMGNDQAF